MSTSRSITVPISAHYQTIGELSKKTETIIFALHGYGQTADYMSKKFDWIDPEREFVICPEGLNSFYWHEGNAPVSCWMTKRHRYHEIENFVTFLDLLYARYCAHVNQQTKVIFFAFSQGCATIWRWIHASKPRVDTLVDWSGWIPEDISYGHMSEYLKAIDIYMHYGTEDNFITEESVKGIQSVIDDNQLDVSISQFEGKHHIPKTELIDFFSRHGLSAAPKSS